MSLFTSTILIYRVARQYIYVQLYIMSIIHIFVLQNVVTTVSGIIFVSNILAPKLCILPDDPAQAYLLSTIIMMAGIGTLFQTIMGVR